LLLCKYFVFIHLPRTGGTFIRETLAKHLPGNWEVIVNPGHATVHEIPAKYRARDGFPGHILEEVAAASPDGHFRTIIGNLLRIPQLEKADIGPMTYVYMNMYGLKLTTLEEDPGSVTVMRFEEMRETVMETLTSAGVPISQTLKDAIQYDPPMNAFERSSYRDCYDDQLRALVAHKDRTIIQKYGYSY
jgi:hypothetical protein